jgi:hypothetical protein
MVVGMDMVVLPSRMETRMTENTSLIKGMVMECTNGTMGGSTMASSSKTNDTVKAFLLGPMVLFMMENLSTAREKVAANTLSLMEDNTKVHGRTAVTTAMEHVLGKTVDVTVANGAMEWPMAVESKPTPMVTSDMKDNGLTTSPSVKSMTAKLFFACNI